jgi:uncharacterized protein (TIGR00251 family)
MTTSKHNTTDKSGIARNRKNSDTKNANGSNDGTSKIDETSQSTSAVNPGQHPAFAWDGDTLVLYILGKPSDKQDAIGKIHGNQLRVSVTAAPRSGKATDHMVKFLAKQFGVMPNDIEVVSGRMNVNKKLRIKAPTQLPSVIAPRTAP